MKTSKALESFQHVQYTTYAGSNNDTTATCAYLQWLNFLKLMSMSCLDYMYLWLYSLIVRNN